MKIGPREIFVLFINTATWLYLFLLIGWIILHFLTGDRIAYLALANFLAVYLFFPLPLVLLVALLTRSRSLAIGFTIGALAFLWLWGPQFLPRLRQASSNGPALTVMTYNVLAWHTYTQPIIENIRSQDVDIVCFQELNTTLARAISEELIDEFPYQVLDPVDNPRGIGVISRYPIHPTGERLPLQWIGGPQVLELNWNGQRVTLVNIHMYPNTRMGTAAVIEPPLRLREAQAQELVNLTRSRNSPVIIAGDANSSPLQTATRIITQELRDSWWEAGFGLGHTFPGSTIPGSDRPRIGNNRYVPPWLTRIDYVFHSKEWETVSARLAPFEGVSDHRGVIATLRLHK